MNKQTYYSLDKSEKLYIIAYCMYVFGTIASSSQMNKIEIWEIFIWIIRILSFLLILLSFFFSDELFDYKKTIISCVFVVVFGLSAITSSKETDIAILLLFILGGINIKSDRVIKFYIFVTSFTVAITLLLYYLGIYDFDSLPASQRPERLFFGFIYTTYLPNYFFHVVCAYISIKRKQINVFEIIVIFIINLFAYKYTDTRIPFYEIIILLFVLVIHKYGAKLINNSLVNRSMIISPILSAFISILLSYFYNSSIAILNRLNDSLSGRLDLGKQAITRYGFKLFGNNISWITGRAGIERSEDYFYVDSSYLNIVLNYGVLMLFLIVTGFVNLIKKSLEEEKAYVCIALVFVILHSITDPQLFELRYNPFLLFLLPSFFSTYKLPFGFKV